MLNQGLCWEISELYRGSMGHVLCSCELCVRYLWIVHLAFVGHVLGICRPCVWLMWTMCLASGDDAYLTEFSVQINTFNAEHLA